MDVNAKSLGRMRRVLELGRALESSDVRERACRVIGHDTVNAPIQEARNVDRLIDRPHVHLDVEAVDRFDDRLRHHPPQALVLRNLKRGARRTIAGKLSAAESREKVSHLVLAEAGRDRRSRFAKAGESAVIM